MMKKKTKSKKLKILAAGDLHGDSSVARKLAKKAEREKVDLVVLLGDIHGVENESKGLIGPFKKVGKKVIFVPGNWDTSFEANMIKDVYDIRDVSGAYVTYDDVGILGVGNPNFALELEDEKIFKKLKKNFEKVGKKKPRKRILISHMHAAGSKAEFSGWEGSKGLRKAIDKFKPDLFLSAHIHEAEGIEEKIGKTKVINVGRKGKVLEV